ncbi:Thymidylate kinase [Ciborinia camelliae]|nr:Thymidylate kinase [Ciborinia camelliae]
MSTIISEPYPHRESSRPISRGSFILIEGLDRAGKTTQVKKLCDRLYASGRNVKLMRFPDRTTPIGQQINSYLQSSTTLPDQSIHLLFSANRWEKAQEIREFIAKGYTIVCDRYYYSGMIYTSSKYPKDSPNHLSLEWCKNPEIGLPMPDKVVFLDLEPEEAEKRGGYGDEKYETREMQRRVRDGFLTLQNTAIPGFEHERNIMKAIDAGDGLDQVAEKIWDVVDGLVEQIEKGELGELGVVR